MIRERYKAIRKLDKMLSDAGIQHEVVELCNGANIVYPSCEAWADLMSLYRVNCHATHKKYYEKARFACSAVQHDFSFGNWQDKIELMGMLTESELEHDDIVVLDCEEVFRRIAEVDKAKKGIDPWEEKAK